MNGYKSMSIMIFQKRTLSGYDKKGFTLVELLVVIAIIAVLASLVTAISMKMVRKSRMVASVSNLKELSAAAHSFASDNYEILPSTTWKSENRGTSESYWWVGLADFLYGDYEGKLNGVFRDPASPEGRKYDSGEFRNAKWNEISYIPWADKSSNWLRQNRGIMLTRLNDASRQPYLSTGVMGRGAIPAVMNEAHFKAKILPSAEWHQGSIIVLYCDGQVKLIKDPTFAGVAAAMVVE
jgi:prepilin-type N-terminal cleavage/methylation domain-containing protein